MLDNEKDYPQSPPREIPTKEYPNPSDDKPHDGKV